MLVAKYSCAQQDLYEAARIGWRSCRTQLVDFTAYKPKYTNTFIDDRLAEVLAASILPDDQARYTQAEVNRIHLVEKADIVRATFQTLKRYIVDAFPIAEHSTRFEEAGQNYYEKVLAYHWDSIRGLLTMSDNFIATHNATLAAADNMPATFPASFATIKSDFEINHDEFKVAEELAIKATQTKIEANNNVYDKLINMFLDGQEIYKADDALRMQFTFTSVVELVSGVDTNGVKGIITSLIDGTPLEGVEVVIEGTAKSTTTDTSGVYTILQVSAGVYDIKFNKAGYEEIRVLSFGIEKGVVKTLPQKMKKL
jgi:hypothetical protein